MGKKALNHKNGPKSKISSKQSENEMSSQLKEGRSKLQEPKPPIPKLVKAITGKKLLDSSIFWIMLAIARVYLSVVHTSYIHPDEFHQSLQVSAYDVLDIDGSKPWEYSSANPIRSAILTLFMSVPYRIMKLSAPFVKMMFDTDLVTPRSLLMWPRLYMTLISFICDYCVFKIASICYVRPWQCVEVFAGSYVMLVYATKTFANSLELVLQCVLLWKVCSSMIESSKIIRMENVLDNLYETAETMKEKVKHSRSKKHLPAHNFVDSFCISVLVTVGVFIRPTFLMYAFVPVAYWLQRGVVTKQINFSYFNYRCLSLLPGIILASTFCVLFDSFYYDSVTLSELILGNITVTSFTVTPINFLAYNSKSNNLAENGLHPYLLHLFVNIPLLHGVLGVIGLWSASKYVASFVYQPMSKKPNVASMASMLLGSFIIPVLALSIIPHQEVRFLLPTLPPLVILHSDKVSIYSLTKLRFTKHLVFLLWQVWNVVCVVFFGFLHQGGVTKTMVFIHDYVSTQHISNDYHVFFSHMYTPPTFLLNRKIPVVSETEDGRRFRVEKAITTHDLGGSLDMKQLYQKLNISIDPETYNNKNNKKRTRIILCIPASLSLEFKESMPESTSVKRLHRLSGHLSTEKLPPFHLTKALVTDDCNEACQITKRIKEFSIDIFLLDFFPSKTVIDKEEQLSVRSSYNLDDKREEL